jgi:hypothetical protein
MFTKIKSYLSKKTLTRKEYNIGSLIICLSLAAGVFAYMFYPTNGESRSVSIIWGVVWAILVIGGYFFLSYLKRFIVK